ncbi:MAG: MBL fold metallo-hydrolase [Planctomycetes bacterium]|nr:MBL fold metallo-hydrolase [Planctomycetota bacterium]
MINLTVTILGSGTAVPWRDRCSPGVVLAVETPEEKYLALIDPSAGSSHRMAACGYPFEGLTHVLFSHYHPDHTGDLVPILFALKNPRFGRVGLKSPLRLLGPPGLIRLHQSLLEVYGTWIDLEGRVRVQEVVPSQGHGFFAIGPLEATCYPVMHSEESVAYRFELRSGKALAYSGDTDRCVGIIQAARNADILILECSYPEGEKHAGHLVPSEAGKIAMAANARRVILTHLYPECWGKDLVKMCREHFSGEVSIAEDGLTIHL